MIGLMNVDPDPLGFCEPLPQPPHPIRDREANPRLNPLLIRVTVILLTKLERARKRSLSKE
jgi:hypothetical protein